MIIEIELTPAEVEALAQLTQRLGHTDARRLTNSSEAAQNAVHALFEIQQALWQGAENAQSN